jgi:hypothetical protein
VLNTIKIKEVRRWRMTEATSRDVSREPGAQEQAVQRAGDRNAELSRQQAKALRRN